MRLISDSFRKVVIAGGLTPTTMTQDGIQIINVIDFLLGD